MVSKPSEQRPLISIEIAIAILFGLAVALIAALVFKNDTIYPVAEVVPDTGGETEETSSKLIDFQSVIDDWKKSLKPSSAEVGVEIFDLDNNQIVANLDKDDSFSTESLYKLFVVYEGYRRLEQGTEKADTKIGKYTFEKCLDLAIRESNSDCAEAIVSRIGAKTMENIISTDFGLKNSSVIDLISTPSDITDMMKIYYEHKDLSEESWRKIQDSMLNQPPVDNGLCYGLCDWRQGLPSGFKTAKVYNKVGWLYNGSNWTSYHDAAIIELNGHHYIITIMTKNSNPESLADLGSKIEEKILAE